MSLVNSTTTPIQQLNNSTLQEQQPSGSTALEIALNQTVAYISLLNIIFGVIGNVVCFLVFVLSRDLRNMSFIVYLTYCSLANIASLFEWNFNHYLWPIHRITLEKISLASCRLVIFMQYFSQQCSAYFLSLMCIDRYVSVIAMPGSLAARLPFSTPRTAHFWSLLIIVVLFGVNSHILILNGYYEPPELRNITTLNIVNMTTNQTELVVVGTYLEYDQTYECGRYTETFYLWPLWDVVNLYVYTIAPFAVMITFNSLLIVKTLLPNKKIRHHTPPSAMSLSNINNTNVGKNASSSPPTTTSSNNDKSRSRRRDKARLTKSLLAITMSFLVMTMPVNIAFGYFTFAYDSLSWLFKLLDCLAFAQQSVLFFNCFATNSKFRLCVVNFLARICFFMRIRRPANRVNVVELSVQRTNQPTKFSD